MRKDDSVHVVMLPWAAFGHLIPFFNLSIALAQVGGVHVSFISTPKSIKRLRKVPPKLTHLVKLVEFPMPVLDDNTLLPEDAEASVDVPPEKIQYLKAASDTFFNWGYSGSRGRGVGWGSVTESLQHGHVVVVLAFVYDQGFNARFLMEKGLGIEVERNEEDGSFTRNEIAKALTYAMVAEEGEELRDRAKEAAAIFGDQKLHHS